MYTSIFTACFFCFAVSVDWNVLHVLHFVVAVCCHGNMSQYI